MKKVAALTSGTIGFLLTAAPAFAAETILLCPKATADNSGSSFFHSLCGLNAGNAIPGVLTLILIIAVIIALFYLIWGGIKWVTSGGDKGAVETARNHIVAAIIGLIIVFLAFFIMNFLFQTFFGNKINGGLELPQINEDVNGEDQRCGQKGYGQCNNKFTNNNGCAPGLAVDAQYLCN